jgi:hypothetical protein
MKKIKLFAAVVAAMIYGNVSAQTITASDVEIEAGGTADVTFTITSETKAALAEFELTLPTGISIVFDEDEDDYVYELGSAMTVKTHSATIKQKESGAYYVLVMNTSGKEFKAESGDYLTVTLKASDDAATGEAKMEKILLVALDESKMNTVTEATFAVTVGGATGINGINADENDGAAYNLAGQKVGKNYRGIIVKNGKKMMK